MHSAGLVGHQAGLIFSLEIRSKKSLNRILSEVQWVGVEPPTLRVQRQVGMGDLLEVSSEAAVSGSHPLL